jgi:GxxExxY protein
MDTNRHEFQDKVLHGDLVFAIMNSAFEVANTIGHGLHEKPYENALVVELGLRGIAVDQQRNFPIRYKGLQVGLFVPDVIVDGKVIVDAKTIDRIGDVEIGQMLNYLRITGLRVGLIINFKNPKVRWERVIL